MRGGFGGGKLVPPEQQGKTKMSIDSNKKLALAFHAAFDSGDKAAFAAICSPKLVATMPGAPGPLSRDAFWAAASGFAAAFSEARHTSISQIAEGGMVASRVIWRGVHTGDFAGIPATGRAVSIDAISVDRIEDGKIVSHDAFFDLASFMGQLTAMAA